MQTNGSIETSYQLYDGLMRPKQTQEAAQGGGRIISDVVYDSRGLEVKENGPYHNPGAPVPDVVVEPDELRLPTQKITEYDLAGRPIKEIVKSENEVKWETNHTYSGDRESVDPPDGETPTTADHRRPGPAARAAAVPRCHAHGHRLRLDQVHLQQVGSAGDGRPTQPATGGPTSTTSAAATVKETDPDTGATTFTFDELDRMKTKTDARGVTLAYEYDSIGRTKAIYEGSLQGHKRAVVGLRHPDGRPADVVDQLRRQRQRLHDADHGLRHGRSRDRDRVRDPGERGRARGHLPVRLDLPPGRAARDRDASGDRWPSGGDVDVRLRREGPAHDARLRGQHVRARRRGTRASARCRRSSSARPAASGSRWATRTRPVPAG